MNEPSEGSLVRTVVADEARYEELIRRLKSEDRKDWLSLAEFYEVMELARFLNKEAINAHPG